MPWGYWNILSPGTYFDLGVLKQLWARKSGKEKTTITIHKDFELYQVLMHNFLSQAAQTFTVYILPAKIIEAFWSRDVTDIWD